ncbi:hypothetical protein CONPUDRAFT_149174 [Coniophora puteana RWD-64-598 SS2]|uniref:Uncharacterized protein n=1 Tax=Coniophora puteana (strain RWD-64-598) TaxID=741705 RepID=A0A5M3N7J6_CONPW|nr:uncharacterized protein CONPUDRAFT_149174 [Coniophora puteana RWD-64-598 SS2]EIW87137.1 hypothetical protein CONPUDRAFT_149174 [Coniophora puteana RWD-64-598 SS2]
MAKPEPPQEKKRTPLDTQAAGRFIRHGVTQSTYAQSTSSEEVVPSTFVPVRVTSKMVERSEYEDQLANESSEEEEELKIFDGDEDEEEVSEDDDGDEVSGPDEGVREYGDDEGKEEQTGAKRRRTSSVSLGMSLYLLFGYLTNVGG